MIHSNGAVESPDLSDEPVNNSLIRRALKQLDEVFVRVIREYPFLIGISLVALAAELGAAILNIATIPPHMEYDLKAIWATGWVLAAFVTVESGLKPAFGAIGDRIGRRPLMIYGPLFSSLAVASMFFLTRPWEFILFNALNGLGIAAFWPSCFSVIADRVRKRDQNNAYSVFNLSYMLGVAFGPLVETSVGSQDIRLQLARVLTLKRIRQAEKLWRAAHPGHHPITHLIRVERIRASTYAHVFGMKWETVYQLAGKHHITNQYRAPFILVAALLVLASLLAALLVPRGKAPPLPDDEEESENGNGTVATSPHPTSSEGLMTQMAIGIRTVPWMMVIAFTVFLGIGLIAPNLKTYTIDVYNISDFQFGLMVLPIAILIAILALPMGALGKRWGAARSVRIGMAICAIGMWPAAAHGLTVQYPGVPVFLRSFWLLSALVCAVGVGFVIAMPAWMTRVTEMAPPGREGAVLGAAAMAQGAGALLGDIFGSHMYGYFKLSFPEAPLFGCAILLTIGSLLTLWHVHGNAAESPSNSEAPNGNVPRTDPKQS